MRTAIYQEQGVVQVVLTPETEFEQESLGVLANQEKSVTLSIGSFYDCNGGWTRWHTTSPYDRDDKSLIIRVES